MLFNAEAHCLMQPLVRCPDLSEEVVRDAAKHDEKLRSVEVDG